jgi:drug/metabolite transporter (DMT)-like permease
VTMIWGSTFIVNAKVIPREPPLAYLALRFGLAAVILFAAAIRRARSARLLSDSLLLGILLALGMATQIIGQTETTASKTAFITGLSVTLTPIVGIFRTRRSPGISNVAGVLLASAGFFLLSWPEHGGSINRGDMMVFLCAVCFAFYIVENGERTSRHDVLLFSAWQMLVVTIVIGGMSFFLRHAGASLAIAPFERRGFLWDHDFVIALAYMATFATIGTFVTQIWAQRRMSATHAAIIFALEPVWAAIFAAILLAERLRPRDIAGGTLVLAGIVVSEIRLVSREET